MIDFERAAKFPMADSDWKRKVLIGGVLNIIPVINFFAIGYAFEVFHKVFRRERASLPEWDEWGKLFVQGLMIFVIYLVYNIVPLILLFIHPIVGFLAFMAVLFLFPAAMAQYAVRNSFSGAFELKDVWERIRQNKNDYVMAWLIMIAVLIVLMIIGMIPVLGWIISSIIGFYVYLSLALIFGEICSTSTPVSQPS